MRFRHAVKTQSGRQVLTNCGVLVKLRKNEEFMARLSVWHKFVTCRKCLKIYEDFHAQEEG